MKARFLYTLLLLCICFTSVAQKKFKLNQKYAKSVVNSIFEAAKSGNYNHLYALCDPNGFSDRDAKRICFTAQLADTVKAGNATENAERNLEEFDDIFKTGKITGEVLYESDGNTEFAKVPIWYNHPQGESRSNETITLVKRSGKWYLYSF